MVSERRLDVLRAIVEDYVATREPVGSRVLVERRRLDVSPATIRNDMAALEESGYIAQPHTSAGRVPTDKGYRLFVDQISSFKPLSTAERSAIQRLLDSAVDLDDVVERTVRLLSQLTRQVAIVQYPSLRGAALRHLELVQLMADRVLLIVITDTGRVEQRTIEVDQQLDPTVLAELGAHLNARVAGRRLGDTGENLDLVAERFPLEHRGLVTTVVDELTDTLAREAEDRVVMAGTAHLARSGIDFTRTISPVLEALEEQVVLLKLLSEMTEEDFVAVRIGEETQHDSLSETAIVATAYGGGSVPQATAHLGVIGPTRMDYPSTMTSVRAVARYLSRILAE